MKRNKSEIVQMFSNSERSGTLKTFAEHSHLEVSKSRYCINPFKNKFRFFLF